jgi:hypothetical protein
MTARAQRILGVAVAAVVVCVAIAFYVAFLTRSPRAVTSSAQLTLQTVGALGPDYKKPDWVSYLAKGNSGKWIHSTNLTVPAHALVRVTIRQYDTATGLRNPFFARAQGTTGGVIEVDGKAVDVIDPNLTSHTFAIPQLGVFVPLPGVADDAKNQCAAAPCTRMSRRPWIFGGGPVVIVTSLRR